MPADRPVRLPPLRAEHPRSSPDVLRIAHRWMEIQNTPPDLACRSARRQGAHLVEIDLRVTVDGTLVCWHDAQIRQPSGQAPWIADLSRHQLCTLQIRPLPLPTALAALARAGLGLYADLKTITRQAAENLLTELDTHGLRHRTVLASGRTDLVMLCAEAAPDVPRAILFGAHDEDPVELGTATRATFVHPCWERFSAPHELLTPAWLARVRRHRLGIVCWHDERPAVVAALYRAGVDGICSDALGVLRAAAEGATDDRTV